MTTFVGFNTQQQYKKFTLIDFELVKRDLLNAFNIRRGQLPGKPNYGTILWDYLFENQVDAVTQGIIEEVQRVAAGDPRIYVSNIYVYPQLNGILIELEIQMVATTTSERVNVFFNQDQNSASYV